MTLRESAAQGIGWSFIRQSGTKLIGFVAFLLMARLLDPRAIGIVAMAKVVTALAGSVLDQGTGKAVIQRQPLTERVLATAFWASLSAGIFLALLGRFGAGWIAAIYREPELEPVLSWLAFGLVLDGAENIPRSILERRLAFRQLAVASLLGELLGAAAGLGLVLSGYGLWGLIAQSLVRSAGAMVSIYVAARWRPAFTFSLRHYRELIGFGGSVAGARALKMLNRRLFDLLIGAFLGATQLGYYTLASRILNEFSNLIMGTASLVSFPAFAQVQDEPHRVLRGMYGAVRLTSLAGFPTFAGLAIVAPQVVEVVFGSQWAPGAPVLSVLALSGLLYSVSMVNPAVYLALGKSSWNLGIALLKTIAVLLAFGIAAPIGITAVAAGYVVADAGVLPFELWAMNRLTGLQPLALFGKLRSSAIATAAMVAAVAAAKVAAATSLSDLSQLGLLVVLGSLVYAVAVRLLERELLGDALEFARMMVPIKRTQ